MERKVTSFAYAAAGQQTIEMTKFPRNGPGGLSYLQRIIVDSNYSSINNTSGATFSQLSLHDTIAELTLEAGGAFWGPKILSGHDLAAMHHAASGRPLTWVDVNGDASVATATNPARRVITVFDFDLFGWESGDFGPPVEYLAQVGGRLLFRDASAVTNVPIVGTHTIYAQTEETREFRAVPQLVCERQGVSQLIGGTIGGGRLLMALLKRTDADWATAPDITVYELLADGSNVIGASSPEVWAAFQRSKGVQTTAANREQYSGILALGEATSRIQPIYPVQPHWENPRVAAKAYAASFTSNMTIPGANPTAAQLLWLTATAKRLSINTAIDQFALCGCSRSDIETAVTANANAMKPKTASKIPGVRAGMWGFLPVKLQDPSFAGKLPGSALY